MIYENQTPSILGMHYGADGIVPIKTAAQARELWGVEHTDMWGVDERDESVNTGGTKEVKFHPGRDYQFGGQDKTIARMEWAGLVSAGLPLKSSLFFGADSDVANDLDILWNVASGSYRGKDGAWLFDAAPNLYIAQETIKQTGELLEEEFIQMSARSLLPSVTHNTWMDVYRYDRMSKRLSGVAQPVSLGGLDTERGVRKAGSYSRTPVYKTLEFLESGASWGWYELERAAESRQYGAPNIDIVRDEIANAILQQEIVYNFATFFSYPQTKIKGLLPALEDAGRVVPAAQQLGAGASVEDDLALFVDNFTEMLISSIMVEKPDTIALGTAAMIYISTTDYKTTDAGMNESLLEAIMRKLGPLGLKDIVWVPEMDYQSEQATSWFDEIGLPQSLADAWAGGLDGTNIMLMFAKNNKVGRMNIGKPIGARPQQKIGERTQVTYLQSLGEYDVRRPKAHRVVKDIGPAAP